MQKARALLDQSIAALGGSAYLNLQDMEATGRTYTFYHGTPNGLGAPFWLFWKWPDKSRIELTKQRDVAYVLNGDKGYEVTYKGTAAEDPEDLKLALRSRYYSLDYVLRKWINEPGVALFYEGRGIADQKEIEKVTVMNARNESVTLEINAITHLPVRKVYQIRDPQTRYFDEEAELYDNWRPIQGIATAHSIVSFHNGDMSRQRFIESVKYNTGIPDSKFEATVNYVPKKQSR
ncbi:MAG: hypothetical protein ACXWCQ_33030 [Burkholderiales bacterium]